MKVKTNGEEGKRKRRGCCGLVSFKCVVWISSKFCILIIQHWAQGCKFAPQVDKHHFSPLGPKMGPKSHKFFFFF